MKDVEDTLADVFRSIKHLAPTATKFADLTRQPFFIYDCEHCDHSGSRCPKHWPMGQTLRLIKPEGDR